MKTIWTIGFTIVITLLSVGLILYLARSPRGEAVVLRPPPTPLPVQVHVSGEVTTPGVYQLPPGSRVLDAVEAAGGFSAEADPEALNLAAYLEDGGRLNVPTLASDQEPLNETASTMQNIPEDINSSITINLNTANQLELETLPGIGPVLAQEIIVFREANGPFDTIEDILEVKGIGPAKFERIKGMITVEDLP